MNAHSVIGIDIGGSHISAAVVDLNSRKVRDDSVARRQVNAKETADRIIETWTTVIRSLTEKFPECSKSIGIAMPGPFDYEKGVCLIKGVDKFEALYGMNLRKIIAERTGIPPNGIAFNNDATCFLRGEVFHQQLEQPTGILGITLGTGLGSATMKNGIYRDEELYCLPYQDKWAEDYLSSRWFLQEYFTLTGSSIESVKQLAEEAESDEQVHSLFETFGTNLGNVLKRFIQLSGYRTIVIGGNLARAWGLFYPSIQQVLKDISFPVELIPARLGEIAPIVGAASIWHSPKKHN